VPFARLLLILADGAIVLMGVVRLGVAFRRCRHSFAFGGGVMMVTRVHMLVGALMGCVIVPGVVNPMHSRQHSQPQHYRHA